MEIVDALRTVHAEYCPEILAGTIEQTRRDIFKIGLVLRPGASLCDVGGGLGAFGPACALLGMKVTVIDDFRDPVNLRVGEAGFNAHKKHGVKVISIDASKGLPLDQSYEVMTCFASIEHYHNSPKRMLHSMMDHLVPGGLFVLSVPNAVDLLKRIQTPLGRARWSPMEEWYEAQEFRGHVREPVVSDLRYLARDLGIADAQILGRNWIWKRSGITKSALEWVGWAIQLWPPLCAELFLIGHRPLG
jgi:2-polyprenyl-3-methyl-5-hydroxy-6-metoxy-1,4-benzoquinol methylase